MTPDELAHGLRSRGWTVYSERPVPGGACLRFAIVGTLNDGRKFCWSFVISYEVLTHTAVDLVDYYDRRMIYERQRHTTTTDSV